MVFIEEFGFCGVVDCIVDVVVIEEGSVCCVDDGVDGESGYVGVEEGDVGVVGVGWREEGGYGGGEVGEDEGGCVEV